MPKNSLDISSLLTIEDHLPHPQWTVIGEWIEKHVSSDEQYQVWTDAVDQWLSALADALDGVYYLGESKNFLLLAPDLGVNAPSLLPVAERCRAALLDTLLGVAEFATPGKLPILVFDGPESLYQYLTRFYPEGESRTTTGLHIREGLPHVVLSWADFNAMESTLAHELTHAALVHLTLPLWVEEGLAQVFARSISPTHLPLIDDERGQRHKRFWRNHGLDLFWSGDGFQRSTPAVKFSYELAEVLMTLMVEESRPRWFGLSRERQEKFFQFLLSADAQDAGEAAACEHLGTSLLDLATAFLGTDDWDPAKQVPADRSQTD